MPRKLSPHQRNTIIERRHAGESLASLSAEFGVTPVRISQIAREAGLIAWPRVARVKRPPGAERLLADIANGEVAKLVNEALTAREVAERYGVSRELVLAETRGQVRFRVAAGVRRERADRAKAEAAAARAVTKTAWQEKRRQRAEFISAVLNAGGTLTGAAKQLGIDVALASRIAKAAGIAVPSTAEQRKRRQ